MAQDQPLTIEEVWSLVDRWQRLCLMSRLTGVSVFHLECSFSKDMFLGIPLIADIMQIQDGSQVQINQNLEKENNNNVLGGTMQLGREC